MKQGEWLYYTNTNTKEDCKDWSGGGKMDTSYPAQPLTVLSLYMEFASDCDK